MTDDIAAIAAGLSKAQRAHLTTKAVWCRPRPGHAERWMTFPPSSTFEVLVRHGLVDRVGQLRDFGLAVRDYLTSRRER